MIKAIVTDIEGTTSSISFVKDTLFPYAKAELPSFLYQHRNDDKVKPLIDEASQQAGVNANDLDLIIENLLRWIDEDLKVPVLKSIQGLIWEYGYRSQVYKAHLYEDAYQHLLSWYEQGLLLYVYSSGSVFAQKLFFTYSEFGDITNLFSGHFDTRLGAKKDVESYCKISQLIEIPAGDILFLSDSTEELDAAKASGINTCCLIRDEQSVNKQNTDDYDHPVVNSFDEIDLAVL